MARSRAARSENRPNRLVRYLREVRAEVAKVVWPSQRATVNLTGVVLATMVVMSIALGIVDWIFTRLFALIIG